MIKIIGLTIGALIYTLLFHPTVGMLYPFGGNSHPQFDFTGGVFTGGLGYWILNKIRRPR
jgi:hypothetical protein